MANERLERREWLRLARAWKRSGLSCQEFAGQEGVNAATLSWWTWKLRSTGEKVPKTRASGRGRASQSRSRSTGEEVPALSFVELEPDGAVAHEGTSPLELEAAGVVVRVSDGFNGPLLARVLDVLEARR